MVLYGLWVVAVNGAVAPAALAGETGTALEPLAAEIGPGILRPGVGLRGAGDGHGVDPLLARALQPDA